MAGKKRRRMKSINVSRLAAMIPKNEGVSLDKNEEPVQQIQPELPRDILRVIIGRLNLRDNICASAVCKLWHSVALFV
nr:F-box/kelch-repeat protein At1g57790-like [Ipomoea batatas]